MSVITFGTEPEQYNHWKLAINGPVATLSMDVQEDETLADGYKLKLNSYDLGVDIELADAVQRIRFEHPEVRAVVITSLKPRIFCAFAFQTFGERGENVGANASHFALIDESRQAARSW